MMIMLHAFLALGGGFLSLLLAQALGTFLLRRVIPTWAAIEKKPGAGYTFANSGILFLSAALGGFVTARLAEANPLIHALALALIVLMLSAMTAMQSRGKQPIWYLLLMIGLTPLGVFVGGAIWLRMMGAL
jgi:hypothetical protein